MEALKSYTVNNAYAAFEEKLKGSLEVGNWRTSRCSRRTS